jgi:hypothetical protein
VLVVLLLIFPAAWPASGGNTVTPTTHAFVGAERCRACHEREHDSWGDTPHAKATTLAKVWGGVMYQPWCLECHATDNDENQAGVQCEMCHGPAAGYLESHAKGDGQRAAADGLVTPTQAVCDRCHDGEDHHTPVELSLPLRPKGPIHSP